MLIGLRNLYIAAFFVAGFIGFTSKYLYSASAGAEILIFFVLASVVYIKQWNSNKWLHLFVVSLALWVALSLVVFQPKTAILQGVLYFSFLSMFFVRFDFDRELVSLLSAIVCCFVLIQFLSDIAFPNYHLGNEKDLYSGTFSIANNKSRYIAFVMPFLVLLALDREQKSALRMLSMISIVFGAISLFMGYSNIVYLFVMVAALVAYFIANFKYAVLSIFVPFLFLIPLFDFVISNLSLGSYEEALIEINTARYFDSNHGVLAVYSYGIDMMANYFYVFGVGLGEFSTRASQIFSSAINAGIPEVMINYGELFQTSSPYGLSSLFVILVEGGLAGLLVISLVLSRMSLIYGSWITRYMVVYLLLMMLYSPVIFEFSELYLYVFSISLVEVYLRGKNVSLSSR